MSGFLAKLGTCNRMLSRVCLWFSASGLVVMTCVIGWQVWARYILNNTPHWSEKLCLFLMLYYILFAAASGVHDKFHIGLTFTRLLVPPRIQRILDVLVNSIVAAFGLGMIWYGTQMARSTWTHIIPTLEISTGYSYLPFPLAGVLFVLFAVEHVLNGLAGQEVAPSWE